MSAEVEGSEAKFTGQDVRIDSLPHAFIADIHNKPAQKIHDPEINDLASEALRRQRDEWNDDFKLTVMTTGGFDMLHMDHAGYLLHAKAAGAATHYEKTHGSLWSALTPEEQQHYTRWALGSDELRLIVSVAGDKTMAAKKGFNPEKGNSPRPVYSWNTRAASVASLAFANPLSFDHHSFIPTVDLVTAHGEHDFDEFSPHNNHTSLAEFIQPDVWVIFGEATDLLEAAPLNPLLAGVDICCIEDKDGAHYFADDVIGRINTSTVIKRIAGEA